MPGGSAPEQLQHSDPGNGRDQEHFRISVDVNLVVLQATARDREGHTVLELGQRDFEVFEDGRPQMIRLFRHEDTPVTVGLVIDHSGSMRGTDREGTLAGLLLLQLGDRLPKHRYLGHRPFSLCIALDHDYIQPLTSLNCAPDLRAEKRQCSVGFRQACMTEVRGS